MRCDAIGFGDTAQAKACGSGRLIIALLMKCRASDGSSIVAIAEHDQPDCEQSSRLRGIHREHRIVSIDRQGFARVNRGKTVQARRFPPPIDGDQAELQADDVL